MLPEDHPMYVKGSEKKEENIEGGCMDCGDSKMEKMNGGRRRRRKPKKVSEKDEMEKMNGGRRRKKVSKKGGDKKAIRVKDVMEYKHKNDVSLKDAWKHFKGC
ncbi:MAG: hypothetical protein EBR82_24050 [Caulobacteraceae bacterium]|nr:hypothetical protein [Caulobacteraceae bacterium]